MKKDDVYGKHVMYMLENSIDILKIKDLDDVDFEFACNIAITAIICIRNKRDYNKNQEECEKEDKQ